MAEENFVHKTLDRMLDVIEVELKLPLGIAEVKLSPTKIAKEWRENEKKRHELENAIQRAEERFVEDHKDQKVAQMLREFPLYAEEEFTQVIARLLTHLREEEITWLAEVKLMKIWGNITNTEEIRNALELYIPYLRDELSTIEEFRDAVSALRLKRIEEGVGRIEQKSEKIDKAIEWMGKDVQQIQGSQNDIRQQIQQFEDQTSRRLEILLQLVSGGSNQIAIQALELSHPDDVTLRPLNFLQRDKLIKALQKDLERTTCLFLVDGSGKGKTQLAVSLHELWNGTNKYWIRLRNKGELQNKHFQIQIIRWLYQITGELSYWQKYLLGDITFREIVIALGESLKTSGMLVIDDLPNPVDFENLYSDLEIIVKVFSRHGSKIVATGQWDVPPHIRSRFSSLITAHSCPSFSLEEILELLGIIQIPNILQTEKIATLISVTTKGHPSLVAATLSWLEEQGKEFKVETFDNLLSGEPVKDTIEYNRKVLIKTLDDLSKELLYRLSVVGEKLDKKLIFEIANLSPVIINPREQLDKLVGPWIDRLDRELFDVSPLLSRVGEDNIPQELVKKIHALCADRYLKVHTIDISDLSTILSHLWQAQDYGQYANVLVLALMAAKTREQANYLDWACSLLLDVKLPKDLETYSLIMVRSAQLRTRALAGGDFKRLYDDLKSLLKDADFESNAPAFHFCYMTTGFFAENLPLEMVIPHSFAAIQLLNSHPTLQEGFSEDFSREQLPDLIWTNTIHIKEQRYIKLFFEQFDELDENIRRLVYVAPLAIEASSHMIDQCWLSEGEKPKGEQDWSQVVTFLNQLSTMSCVQESESLRVVVSRSKAVVYADYLKQRDQAIAILDELSEINNPDAYFLVNYSKGCFALDDSDYSATVKFLTIAENTDGESFAYYRLATTRQLVIALEWQNEWELAKKYCLKVIRDFREYDFKSEKLEFCELLGELAYIYWASGNPQKACGAMYGYIRELIKHEDVENLRYKEVFNKAGHALGWFSSVARLGTPPPKTPNDEEYAPVQPGLFAVRRTKVGEHVPPVGFAISHLLSQLALFAQGVELARMSRSALKLSLEYLPTEKSDSVSSQFTYITLTTLETILGSPSQALQYGLQTRKIPVSISVLGEQLTQLDSASHVIDEYKDSEERFRLIIFMPLFSKLIGSNWSETEILDELERWNTEILKLKSKLLLADDWLTLIKYFKDLVIFWKGDSDIDVDNEYVTFEHETSFEMFKELLGSDKAKVALRDAYISQVRVAISLPSYGEYSRYMYSDVGRFVHRYWLRIAQTQRFALRHPSLFLEELKSISPLNGAETLYEVLISAGRAVGVNLPDDVKMKMKTVKKMAKPWLEV